MKMKDVKDSNKKLQGSRAGHDAPHEQKAPSEQAEYFGELNRLTSELIGNHGEAEVRFVSADGRWVIDSLFRPERKIVVENARFFAGQVGITHGAGAALGRAKQSAQEFLQRHLNCDWGELDQEDKEANDRALRRGGLILSHYRTTNGDRLYVHTSTDRSLTTVMLPEEW